MCAAAKKQCGRQRKEIQRVNRRTDQRSGDEQQNEQQRQRKKGLTAAHKHRAKAGKKQDKQKSDGARICRQSERLTA